MTAHVEVARMQIDCRGRNSGNSALVFQHLSFQSYHVIHQQEHNTVDWRTVEKTQQNWGGKLYFLLFIVVSKTKIQASLND